MIMCGEAPEEIRLVDSVAEPCKMIGPPPKYPKNNRKHVPLATLPGPGRKADRLVTINYQAANSLHHAGWRMSCKRQSPLSSKVA